MYIVSHYLIVQAFNAILIAVLLNGYSLSSSIATTALALEHLMQHVFGCDADRTTASLLHIFYLTTNLISFNAILIAVLRNGYSLSSSIATTEPALEHLMQHVFGCDAD